MFLNGVVYLLVERRRVVVGRESRLLILVGEGVDGVNGSLCILESRLLLLESRLFLGLIELVTFFAIVIVRTLSRRGARRKSKDR